MTEYRTPALLKRLIKEKIRTSLARVVKPAIEAAPDVTAAPAVYETAAGPNVFASRSIPTDSEHDTVILIYGTGEQVTRFDQSPKSYRRIFAVRIECIDYGDNDDDLDFRLERLGEAVERVMEQDETLGGLVNTLELSSTDYAIDSEATSPTGMIAFVYNVEFFTFPGVDADGLADFDQANFSYNVGHNAGSPDEVADVTDQITLNEEGSL